MSLSVDKIGRIFQTYQKQERIADLNRQANLRTVQNPSDRVSISTKAREMADAQNVARTRPPRVRITVPPPPPVPEPVPPPSPEPEAASAP